jgi:hypothetical protein
MTMRFKSLITPILLAAALATAVPVASFAQRNNQAAEQEAAERIISPEVGEHLVKGQEAFEAKNYAAAGSAYQKALSERGITAYEKGIVYQLLAQIAIEQDSDRDAINWLARALNEGALNAKERQSTIFNLGNLNLRIEDYRAGANYLEQYLREGGQRNEQLFNNLVFAYDQQGNKREALRYALLAFEIANPKKRQNYDTLNYLYTELNMPAERAALLQEMVQLYPQDKTIWNSIAALYAQGDQESKAFEIRKIMYLNGLLTTEKEIQQFVDYYSYYDVPFRGAEILKREMNRGRVERTQANLEKLARLYRQAREFNLAVEPLRAAAEASGKGKLFQELGEALYAEGREQEAEKELLRAIERGIDRPGDAWIVIGNARYQADNVQGALEAFSQAARYPYSRRNAEGWSEFIRLEIETARTQAQKRAEIAREELRLICERRARGTDILEQGDVINPRTGEKVDCDSVLASFRNAGGSID